MWSKSLNTNTVALDLSFFLKTIEIVHDVFCESIFTGDEDGLTAWELELGSGEGFLSVLDVFWSGTD